MDHRSRFSTLSARYDDFLFAPVCEDPNGLRLSVLSALARFNVDPWEEAARLAAMPKQIAETTLLSILDLVSGRSWKSSEAAAAAAQLVRLLPRLDEATATATADARTGPAHRTNYWWLWLAFWIAMTFMMPHRHTPPPNPTTSTSDSGATSQFKSKTPDSVVRSR
ncbi:MAG TPA: hypothetical protein VGV41_00350 [Pseudolabrys sp.]|uniref:hypothetical protein n=1 Tax=Pseudolabrys sp. TaxID=1960880 RepID=UPI002DDDB9C7|nr:hypothetical protein [Pseudolabrys sp.]HEV2627080.1 hypothetical protein [Pseudolabrys sp.]